MANDKLIIKSAALARSSPLLWAEFLAELAAYTEVGRNNCVVSPLEQLPVNQGKAQALTALTEILRNAVSSADTIKQRTSK